MSDFETRKFGDVTCIKGDCLDVLPTLQTNPVQMVFADVPYGVTRGAWDIRVDMNKLWPALWNASAKNAPIIMTATQPFASCLIFSQKKHFRYDLIYQKSAPTGFLNSKRMPLRAHESLLVFYASLPTFYPQMTTSKLSYGKKTSTRKTDVYGKIGALTTEARGFERYPISVLAFPSIKKQKRLHSTQKPVALLEWLIATYTNPGDLVLDPTAGSGSTGVAALNLGRRAVLIEKDPAYFEVMCKRIAEHQQKMEAIA